MKFKIQVVSIADTGEQETLEVAIVERRDPLRLDTLGLSLAEGKEILKDIQQVMVEHQTTAYMDSSRQCLDCGHARHSKGYHAMTVRTVFGKMKVRSLRLKKCSC